MYSVSNMSRGQMSSLVEQLNASYMGSPKDFISQSNPFAKSILGHCKVSDSIRRQEHHMRRYAGLIDAEDDVPFLIESSADLAFLPDAMKIPVLSDYRIWPYLREQRICGWDVSPDLIVSAIGRFNIPQDEFDAPVSFNTTAEDDTVFDMYVEHAANVLHMELMDREGTLQKDPSDPMRLHPIYDEIV